VITLKTWQAEVERVGEYWARRNLRHICRTVRYPLNYLLTSNKPEEFKLLCDLAYMSGATPLENRKKFADIFRVALRRIKENRLRIQGYGKKIFSDGVPA